MNEWMWFRLTDEPESAISETGMPQSGICEHKLFFRVFFRRWRHCCLELSYFCSIIFWSCLFRPEKLCLAKWPILLYWWQVLAYTGHFILPPSCRNCPPQFRHCLRAGWRVPGGVFCWFFADSISGFLNVFSYVRSSFAVMYSRRASLGRR